jgi:hypothetical protein
MKDNPEGVVGWMIGACMIWALFGLMLLVLSGCGTTGSISIDAGLFEVEVSGTIGDGEIAKPKITVGGSDELQPSDPDV